LLNKLADAPVWNVVGWEALDTTPNQNACGLALGLLTDPANTLVWLPSTVTAPWKAFPDTTVALSGTVATDVVKTQKLGYVNDPTALVVVEIKETPYCEPVTVAGLVKRVDTEIFRRVAPLSLVRGSVNVSVPDPVRLPAVPPVADTVLA
jgi:hypothetical protein